MESLIYAVVPSLAPRKSSVSHHSNSLGRSSAGGSRPGSRLSRPDSRSSGLDGPYRSGLEDDREEKERKETVKQLMGLMEEFMDVLAQPQ